MRLQAAINSTHPWLHQATTYSLKRPCGATTPHRDRWAAIVSRLPLYSPISDSDKSGRRSVGDRTRPAISARFRAGVGGCAITRASRAGLRAENWSQPDGDRQNRGSIDRIHHPLGVAAYHINSSRAATGDGVSRIGAGGLRHRSRPLTSHPCGLDRSDRRRCVAVVVVDSWFHC